MICTISFIFTSFCIDFYYNLIIFISSFYLYYYNLSLMGKYGRIIFWVALLILFNFAIFAMYKSKIPTESNSHVTFSNDVKLSIRIAHSSEAKAQWLMWVESMPMDHGMIFVYDPDKITNFWMKNTIIPLDMIFIWSDMQIKTIHTWAIPMDESCIKSSTYQICDGQ